MNIALIVTLGGDLVRSTEHVGIGYLSAYLRKHGHKVKVLEIKEPDIQNEGRYIPALADCEFVGFTTTCVTMKNVACLVDVVKSNFPNSYIACGGHMATFSGKELLEKYKSENISKSVVITVGKVTGTKALVDWALQREGDEIMCTNMDRIFAEERAEGRQEGRKAGLEEARREIIQRMLSKGMDKELIADILDISIDEIKTVCTVV